MNTAEYLNKWAISYKDDIINNIMPFWMKYGLDKEHGGVYTCVNRDGSLMDTTKSVWFQGRFGFIAAYAYNNIEKNPQWLAASKSCIDFIEAHCFDTDGHMFFEVTEDGVPLRKRRYVFSEGFAAIAMAEYSLATGEKEYAEKALEIFKRTQHFLDTPGMLEPKYLPAMSSRGHSITMILINTASRIRMVIDDPVLTEQILSQAQRDYVMQKFRVKNIQLLVATDVAARGLDVDDLTHVINYGLPDEVESYTHRRGRTGRAGKTGISISICHVKEKGKIREIERIINKKFEKGEMPTGHAICEKQLFNLVDQIEKVKVNEEEIASLMPQIYRKLEWLDKEDIIKRVVSLEFNRMIDYYKDADEIQQVDERSSRSERGERRAHAAEEGYSRFFLNFGKADGLYPNQLIELVNKCVPGKVRIGKIDLRENFSFFEVEEGEAQRVMDSMNGFEVDGRRISVEPAQGKKEEGGRGGKRSYGGRRSDDGYKGKRGSKDSGRRGGDRSDRTFRKDERDSDRPWKRTAAARDARKKRRF